MKKTTISLRSGPAEPDRPLAERLADPASLRKPFEGYCQLVRLRGPGSCLALVREQAGVSSPLTTNRFCTTMIPVDSDAIRAVGYRGGVLLIQFRRGDTIYSFPGVPYSVFEELLDAESKGTYYHQHICGRYR